MRPRRIKPNPDMKAQIIANARNDQAEREKGYREQAMKLFPHLCARCCREFSGARLRELTVHHKDHNHGNNPPDGSNWELLCLYCHDNAHQDLETNGYRPNTTVYSDDETPSGFQAFAGLKHLIKPKDNEPDADR